MDTAITEIYLWRSRLPVLGHREPHDVGWLNNSYKPAWVNAQLTVLDVHRGGQALTCDCPDPRGLTGYGRYVTADTVSRLCGQGQVKEAVEALGVLVQADRGIQQTVLYTVLKRCVMKKDLVLGRRVHALIVKKGSEPATFLWNNILRMYASHGRLQEAMDVFNVVAQPDAFTWSCVISAHAKHGQAKEAIRLYQQMRRSSVKPDAHVFVAALQACARGTDIEAGQQVHTDVVDSGLGPGLFVSNALVDMYAKCGSLEDAQRVFDELSDKDVVTWNAMLAGYSQHGRGLEALRLYRAMQEESITEPDCVTFVCLLQACASLGATALENGKEIHSLIGKQGLQADVFVGCSLVNMYAKCGSLQDARSVFDALQRKDVVTWNAIIAGYSQQGMGEEALHLRSAMVEEGITAPDSVTFLCVLQACASLGVPALEKGKQIHAQLREKGLQADVFLGCSLVDMYAKCGSMQDAQKVFDGLGERDLVTWTALIAGYTQQGMAQEALCVYSAMQKEGIAPPNSVTYVCLLQACATVGAAALNTGKQLHAQIRDQGLQADVVIGCSLVNMYVKCGSLQDARGVFNELSEKNVVTWTALITGYSQQGMGQEALNLYRNMQEEGISEPNSVTFLCLLQACANVGALHLGRQLHVDIQEQGLETDVFVAISVINMYAKCGSMVDARLAFDKLPEKDVVAWNALIAGYTRQGDSQVVFDLVDRMKQDGVQPNDVTFNCLLTVCSHAGLVNRGREYFKDMSKLYGINPNAEHYTCFVDLLGRAGHLDEGLAVARTMPVRPDAAVWHTLLGACRTWGNVEVGRHAFNEAVKLDEKDPAAYVLVSSIYTGAQMWEEAEEMQARRKRIGAWKQPGQSWWTDMDGFVHHFSVGDTRHPESDDIHARLEQLVVEMQKHGLVSYLRLPSADMSDDFCWGQPQACD